MAFNVLFQVSRELREVTVVMLVIAVLDVHVCL